MLLFSFEKSGDHVLHPTKKLKQSPTWRHRNLDDGNSNAGRQCSLSGSDPYYTVAPVVPSTLAWSRGFFFQDYTGSLIKHQLWRRRQLSQIPEEF